ncbi:MAG: hypothetical protein K2K57_08010 [Oscillospiraceae bacterium]|nr:hypothetical protein [Oscillospiraceae bacterium]
MKKIIIGVSCAVLLAAAGLAYDRINSVAASNISNTAYVDETGFYTEYAEAVEVFDENAETVYSDYSDFTVTAFHDTEENVFLPESKLVSELLKNVEWIDRADVAVFKPESFDGSDYSNVTLAAVLEMNKQPENEEIDGVVHMITLTLEGVKAENITIMDEAGNVLNS